MKRIPLLALLMFAGCANGPGLGPVSARQRAEAATDVPEDHPHPPALRVPTPGDDGMAPLRCWDNGEDRVCKRSD